MQRLAPAAFLLLWSAGFSFVALGLPDSEPLTFLALRYAIVVGLLAVAIAAWAGDRPRRRGDGDRLGGARRAAARRRVGGAGARGGRRVDRYFCVIAQNPTASSPRHTSAARLTVTSLFTSWSGRGSS
jgi:hypothetical protein